MAQLNCPTCFNGMWMDQWGNVIQEPQRSGSNVSLNMPPTGYPQMPMWMNPMGTWHGASPSMGMFPYPMGMGMPMQPTNMEPHSRSHSRAGSPTPSIKSRKSHVSTRNQRKYREESDDEADRRSVFSYADRSERKSVRDRAEKIRQKKEAASNTPREIKVENKVEEDKTDRLSVRDKEDRFERVSIRSRDDRVERESIRSRQKNISSESDDYKSDSQKESEAHDSKDEEEIKIPEEKPEVEVPAVPDQEWECEHCTFVNEAGTRVCSICCKTPTIKVKVVTKKPPSNKVSSGTNTVTSGTNTLTRTNKEKKTEEITSKLRKIKTDDEPILNNYNRAYEGKINGADSPKKGRSIRKITFWPGTKFPPFYK